MNKNIQESVDATRRGGKTNGTAGHSEPVTLSSVDWTMVLAYATAGLLVLLHSEHKRNETLRFHAFQALGYLVASLVGYAVLSMLGGSFEFVYRPLYVLAAVGGAGYLLWQVYQGKPPVLPILGTIARRQATLDPNPANHA